MIDKDWQKVENRQRKKCFEVVDQVLGGCARDFDGFFCWPSTSPGTLARQNCSNDYLLAAKKGVATRECTINGTWFTNGNSHAWTNFSQCGDKIFYYWQLNELNEVTKLYAGYKDYLDNITLIGYALSIISLMVAITIFICLKRLHCERNKLHVNLFLSYLIKSVIYVTKQKFFRDGTFDSSLSFDEDGTLKINYVWYCKLFQTLDWYFVLANFTFLLMEGLYLRNLIFLNLFSESHGTGIYCIVGWVTPIFFIAVWVILKILMDDNYCWNKIDEDKIPINYLIDVPIIITVLANLVLFVIIMRVLIMKIHFTATFIRSKRTKYRQLIRSTLILIPLYGIPYVFSAILRLLSDKFKVPTLDVVYIFFDQITSCFQGLFAALVYCLLNNDVRYELVRKYTTLIDQTNKEFRRSRTISSNTQQFSLQNTEDGLENLKLFGIVEDDSMKIKTTNGHSRLSIL